MAHELIDRFGDFAGVLDASEEDLMTVEGVGPATARMLHLMPDVCRYYTQCRTGRNGCLKTTEQLAEHLMGLFAGAAQERALLLALDSRSRVRAAPTGSCSATTTQTAWRCPRGRTSRPPRTSSGRWGSSMFFCGTTSS